jgi:transposase
MRETPGLAEATAVAKRLSRLLRRDSDESQSRVFDAATNRFSAKLPLACAAMALPCPLHISWTTSPAEGQFNRIKISERTMYGHAGFEHLSARVLRAA